MNMWDKDVGTFQERVFTPNDPPGVKNLPQHFNHETRPLDCLELFWTGDMWSMIVTETNRHADNVKAAKPTNYVAKNFKHVTTDELQAFFGIRIAMEMLIHKDRYEMYWRMENNSPLTYTPGFAKIMSRDRFLAIWTMLHCVNEDDCTLDKSDKIYKNRPILDTLIKKFQDHYVPEQEMSLDEGMIPCKKALSIKQYIKTKPVKWGLKSFILCEGKSGYIVNAEIYTGKHDDANTIVDLGVTGNLVVRLSSPYSGQNYCLYTDRFYTSVALCEHLLGVDTLLCGTAQTNRKKFPKDLVKKKMDRGSSDMRFNGKCAAFVWCDKRPIYFVTSTHVDAPQQTVMRYDAREHRRIPVTCPKAVKSYNQFMGGTDKNDQLTRLQRCRRHYRWPRRLTMKFMMWAIFNNVQHATSSYASGLATKIASMPTIPKCSTGDKVRIFAILCSVFPVRSFWQKIPVKMTYLVLKNSSTKYPLFS